MHWTHKLTKLGACRDAVAWAGGYATADEAWAACERGDWMLWLAGRTSGNSGSDSRRLVVRAAAACARLSLPQWIARYPNDGRVLAAIEAAEEGDSEKCWAAAWAAAAAAAAADEAWAADDNEREKQVAEIIAVFGLTTAEVAP